MGRDCSSDGPGFGAGMTGVRKVPGLGTKSWKVVEETQCRILSQVRGDRPKDAS